MKLGLGHTTALHQKITGNINPRTTWQHSTMLKNDDSFIIKKKKKDDFLYEGRDLLGSRLCSYIFSLFLTNFC